MTRKRSIARHAGVEQLTDAAKAPTQRDEAVRSIPPTVPSSLASHQWPPASHTQSTWRSSVLDHSSFPVATHTSPLFQRSGRVWQGLAGHNNLFPGGASVPLGDGNVVVVASKTTAAAVWWRHKEGVACGEGYTKTSGGSGNEGKYAAVTSLVKSRAAPCSGSPPPSTRHSPRYLAGLQ
ncbi:hypothetical protein E2C01_049972 [Portunus trituberculatus]|uniref:Uncharacterized protein n=1 Tax=Portunus trituberculatus TaxID=210409 RepID=A0A5B7GFA4_PORTR|nr:hypothetical protein [Portunus trituberculatus]